MLKLSPKFFKDGETMNYVSGYKSINRRWGTNNVKAASRKDENGASDKTRTCDKLSKLINSETLETRQVGINIIKGLIDFKQARKDSWFCAGTAKQNQGLENLQVLSQQDMLNVENSNLPNLQLTELEILVKNSSLFVQRDIPSTFKNFLKHLSRNNPHLMKEIITDENSGFLRKNGITLESNKANTKTIQARQQDNVHFYRQYSLVEPKPFLSKNKFCETIEKEFLANKETRLVDDNLAKDQVGKDFFRSFNTDPKADKLNINGEYVNLDVVSIERIGHNTNTNTDKFLDDIYNVLNDDRNLHKFLEEKDLISEKDKIIYMIMFSSNQMLKRSGLLSTESFFDLQSYMPGDAIETNININTNENTIEYKYKYKLASTENEGCAHISSKHSVHLNSQEFNGCARQIFNKENRELITDIEFTSVEFCPLLNE